MLGYETETHKQYWKNRQIDWRQHYMNPEHPHRRMLLWSLGSFPWFSLMEVGCGAGANLVNIVQNFPNRQVGGIDINADAIKVVGELLTGAYLKVGSVEDIMMSDKATDVVLSDMCLIYIDPHKIDGVIKEIQRIARTHVVFCEFHHESWFKRLAFRWKTGYNAYNYTNLLTKHGFYDVRLFKIPPDMWPGGEPQKTFGYIIIATVPKR